MCSGKEDTWTFRSILHLKDIYLDSLGRLEFLALHLLVLTEDTVGSSQVDADIPSHHPLYDTGDNLFLLTVILIVENLALLLADLLQDHVFGVLRGDTAELLRLDLHLHDIAGFRVGIDLTGFFKRNLQSRILDKFFYLTIRPDAEITCLRINGNMYVIRLTEMILAGLDQ